MSQPFGKLDLDAIQALCDAATPGPWRYERVNVDTNQETLEGFEVICEPGEEQLYARVIVGDGPLQVAVVDGEGKEAPDAAFIAAAREAVPALIAEVRRLRGIRPELGPFPPEGDGLPRYGIRWNGPTEPLGVPMPDGYWTPWHLADQLRAENERLRKANLDLRDTISAESTSTEDSINKVRKLRAENEALKASYESACALVARMHEAAMGEVCGPRLGVVEDVAALRAQCESLKYEMARIVLATDAASAKALDAAYDICVEAGLPFNATEGKP